MTLLDVDVIQRVLQFSQINDKPEFADFLNDLLFDRYAERKTGSGDEEKSECPGNRRSTEPFPGPE